MLRMFFLVTAMIGCVGFAGCDFPDVQRPVASNIGGMDTDGGVATAGQSGNTDTTQTANPPAPPAQPQVYHTTAQAGDSGFKKGQGYGRMSIFGSNVASLYRTNERINLQMIEYNMKLYKAEHGNAPKTHEEFMSKIIQAGMIKLPELKEGCRYEYNPQTEELEIVHPIEMKP